MKLTAKEYEKTFQVMKQPIVYTSVKTHYSIYLKLVKKKKKGKFFGMQIIPQKRCFGAPGWLSSLAPAFHPRRDSGLAPAFDSGPYLRVLGLSPPSGSLLSRKPASPFPSLLCLSVSNK